MTAHASETHASNSDTGAVISTVTTVVVATVEACSLCPVLLHSENALLTMPKSSRTYSKSGAYARAMMSTNVATRAKY